jgi:LytS/YehU family sensor histidine kinase
MQSAGRTWIRMKVECSPVKIEIQIGNSWRNKVRGTGIGLDNLRSQLNHLYPDNHSLLVDISKLNEFSVNLILNVKK